MLPAGAEQSKAPTGGKETPPIGDNSERSRSGPLSLRIILITRDISSRTWFLTTIGELLSKYLAINSSSYVRVEVYLTGEAVEMVNTANIALGDPVSSANLKGSSALDRGIFVQKGGHEATVPGEE